MICSGYYDYGEGVTSCNHTTADGCPDAPPCSACGERHSTRALGGSGCPRLTLRSFSPEFEALLARARKAPP